jgi:hypothetical protein
MRLKDTKGKESTTLTIVVALLIVLTIKFLLGGLMIPILGTLPIIGAGEFGLAATGLLAIWLNREWKETKNGS